MKKDSGPHTWTTTLWNGIIGELIFGLGTMGIGIGIAILLPHEMIKDIPAELFFILSGFILCAIVGIVALIAHLIRSRKKNKDIKFIYNTLKNKYKLTLLLISKGRNGEMHDFLTIKGQSSKGKFELHKENEMFNLWIKYFENFNEDGNRHEILNDRNEAINFIEIFMSE